MQETIPELLHALNKKTGYSYNTLCSVNHRITNTLTNLSFNKQKELLLSLIEFKKYIVKEDNQRICINGYKLNINTDVILSDILIKKYHVKNKPIEEILDEYLKEKRNYLMMRSKLINSLKNSLGVCGETIRDCFYLLKKNHKELNYKELIDTMTFLLQFKGKFSFVSHKHIIKFKNNFYNVKSNIAFIETIINIKINNKEASPDEIINIYVKNHSNNKVFIDDTEEKEIKDLNEKIKNLEIQISENLGYSPVFFKRLFNMLKCRNSSITDYDYLNCLKIVIDLSPYVHYQVSRHYKIIIEKYNYSYNVSTFWIMLFELRFNNPSLTLDETVLKVIEQTVGNNNFSGEDQTLENKGTSITKKG